MHFSFPKETQSSLYQCPPTVISVCPVSELTKIAKNPSFALSDSSNKQF